MEGDRVVKKQKMSALEQLKKITTIVADTGDFEGKLNDSSSLLSYVYFIQLFAIKWAKVLLFSIRHKYAHTNM